LNSAGITLIVCSLAFVGVFTYLAGAFGYPDILDRGASEVLPRLAAGGQRLRIVWFLYAALPLGIVYSGAAAASVLERGGKGLRALGVTAAFAAGIAMMIGLLRWPTIEWTLARYWDSAPASSRTVLAAIFDASNLFLGNVIGEFIGEMCVALWFVTLGVAFRRDGRRWPGFLGLVAGILVAVAGLRNITSAVALVADINNVTLPLWLLTLGVLFLRDGCGKGSVRVLSAAAPGPVSPAVRPRETAAP
jgi:hypothetical protein